MRDVNQAMTAPVNTVPDNWLGTKALTDDLWSPQGKDMKHEIASAHRRGFSHCCVVMLGLFLGLLGGQEAAAACSKNPSFPLNNVYLRTEGPIVMRTTDPVGTVYVSRTFPLNIPGNTRPFLCQYTARLTGTIENASMVNIGDYWHTTNVPGVAIRLSRQDTDGNGVNRNLYYPYLFQASSPDPTNPIVGFFNGNLRVLLEIKKYRQITGSGPIAPGLYSRYYGDGDGQSVIDIYVQANALTVVSPSCQVDAGSRNIPVSFGKVPASSFQGRGTTAEERKFKIKLVCDLGLGMVNLRMDGVQDPAGDEGVLQISQGGNSKVAGGVGIQLKNDFKNRFVKFGEEVELGRADGTDYEVPFTARYFQTGDRVTPGRADGTATFTITYK